MNYENDILARMANGENFDTIADEFTKALNSAKRKKEAQVQEDKRKKEAELDKCATSLVNALKEYLTISNPKLVQQMPEDAFDAKAFRRVIDGSLTSMRALMELDSLFEDKPITKHLDTDDSIENFLKKFVD